MNHRVAVPVAVAGSLATVVAGFAVPGPFGSALFTPAPPTWNVTSGSLFGDDAFLWSGMPQHPDSAVLRAVGERSYGDVAVRFDLRVDGLSTTARTPERDFDGVHVMLRYRSEEQAYFVSVSRRDGRFAVKRKTPGGPSNGGTYRTLAFLQSSPLRGWHHVEASIRGDRTVTIALRVDGFGVLTAIDHVPAGTPATGRVGLRGDNCDFLVRDYHVGPVLTRL